MAIMLMNLAIVHNLMTKSYVSFVMIYDDLILR